jgi:hypothetical protein
MPSKIILRRSARLQRAGKDVDEIPRQVTKRLAERLARQRKCPWRRYMLKALSFEQRMQLLNQ